MTEPLRIPVWAGLLLLIVAIAAVSAPALPRAAFLPDDYRYLAQLRDIDAGVPGALARSTVVENRWDDNWWIDDGTFVRFFRPLVILSYALDRAVCGENDRGFVVGNIVLHLLVTLLVWGCLRALLSLPIRECCRPAKILASGGVAGMPGGSRKTEARPSGAGPSSRSEGGPFGCGCEAALGTDGPALLGALWFAMHSSRAEQICYVAGRTDTLAALFFFAGLGLFLRGRSHGGRAWVGGVAGLYLLAMLVKEYAVLLPAFFVLADRQAGDGEVRPWLALLQRRRALYAACAAAAFVFFAVRWWALGDAGSGVRPFPYFHLPDRDGFAGHAVATSLQYAVSLVSGLPCATFLTTAKQLATNLETLFERAPVVGFLQGTSWWWIVSSAIVAPALLLFGLRSARGRFFVVFFLVTLLPMLPLYSTSRYLYLPGLGWCGLVALAVAGLWRARRRVLAASCALLLIVPQAVQCHWILTFSDVRPPGESDADSTVRLLRESRLQLAASTPVYLVDLPRPWIVIQFLQSIVDLRLADAPRVRVLCKAPYDPRSGLAEITRVDEHTIELTRPNGPLQQPDPGGDFAQRRVRAGERIREADYELTVLAVAGERAQRVRIRFDRPLAELAIGKCLPQGGEWRIVPVR